MSTRGRRHLQWSALGIVFVLVRSASAFEILYHATEIPRFGPDAVGYDVNDAAQVAGTTEGGTSRAFRWDSETGKILDLGTLPGGTDNAGARGINNLGQVVGSTGSTLGGEAFLWDPASGMVGLGILPGYPGSGASSVNNFSEVCGSNFGSSTGEPVEAYLWTPQNGMIGLSDLPGGDFWSSASDINDLTQISGKSHSAAGTEGFFWSAETGMIGIGDLPGGGFHTEAKAINNLGQIVGMSSSSLGAEAFLWSRKQGMIGLGNLGGVGPGTLAFGINDRTQVVGWAWQATRPVDHRGFIWDEQNGMRDLNALLDAASRQYHVGSARGINNRGQIITQGRGDMLLLTPFVLADMNCDDALNAADVDPFFLALVDYERYEGQYPSCHGDWAGDVNQDARFDAADIDAFFELLGG
ncbi:MAG: hypothetical protein IH986_00925 [Planctomycetes bacterium]|nr:hypothetical protein [Planctomycetota bacterium]